MSFGRQKPTGWVLNDPITPAQIDGIDANLANAFDTVDGEIITGDSEWRGKMEMAQSGDGGSVKWRTDTLVNANATLDVDVDEYIFTVAPTGDKYYTLRHSTSPTPVVGSRIRVTMPFPAPSGIAHFQREDTTEIAKIVSGGQGGDVGFIFHGGEWHASGVGESGEYV